MACFVFASSRKLSMKSLQKLKISTVPFRLSTAKLCIKLKGGGNRLKTVGYDVGILHDLVGVGAHDDPAFTPQC